MGSGYLIDMSDNTIVWEKQDPTTYPVTKEICMVDLNTKSSDCIGRGSYPRVDGNNIVYVKDGNIRLYNGTSNMNLTYGRGIDSSPDISGNYIVWSEKEPGSVTSYNSDGFRAVFLLDMRNGSIRKINTARSHVHALFPRIDGENVVFEGPYNDSERYYRYHYIHLYNIASGVERNVTSLGGSADPEISGDSIVYYESLGTPDGLYLYDIKSGKTKDVWTRHGTTEMYRLFDNTLAWVEPAGTDVTGNEIFLMDLSTKHISRLTNDQTGDYNPTIAQRGIAWSNGTINFWAIPCVNTTTTTTTLAIGAGDECTGSNYLVTDSDGIKEYYPQNGSMVWKYETSARDYPHYVARLSNGNTLITATIDGVSRAFEVNSANDKIWEYQYVINSHDSGLSSAQRLDNENTLVVLPEFNMVREVAADKTTVWEYGPSNGLNTPAHATRLQNGNTLIVDNERLQVIEVTPGKQVVWAYSNGPYSRLFYAYRLSNRNTLITSLDESTGIYHVTEVNASKDVVWEYSSPDAITSAVRLANQNTLIFDADLMQVIEMDPSKVVVRRLPLRSTPVTGKYNSYVTCAEPTTTTTSTTTTTIETSSTTTTSTTTTTLSCIPSVSTGVAVHQGSIVKGGGPFVFDGKVYRLVDTLKAEPSTMHLSLQDVDCNVVDVALDAVVGPKTVTFVNQLGVKKIIQVRERDAAKSKVFFGTYNGIGLLYSQSDLYLYVSLVNQEICDSTSPNTVINYGDMGNLSSLDPRKQCLICSATAPCSKNKFCELPSCSSSLGMCTFTPKSCAAPSADSAVCGCNGKSYNSDCLRQKAKVPAATPGRCTTTTLAYDPAVVDAKVVRVAGGSGTDNVKFTLSVANRGVGLFKVPLTVGADCEESEGCPGGFEASETVNRQIRAGQTVNVPFATLFSAVSGKPFYARCNFSVSAEGDASAENNLLSKDVWALPLKCEASSDCNSGYYCERAKCARYGKCMVVPSSCPDTDAPVCGCDGVTYGNDCKRKMGLASIRKAGICPDAPTTTTSTSSTTTTTLEETTTTTTLA
jgi:hypothetical protein